LVRDLLLCQLLIELLLILSIVFLWCHVNPVHVLIIFSIKLGIFITMGLIIGLTVLLLYVDWCVWKIVRLPLSPFYLTRPFLISAILVSFAGYVCVPIFRHFKAIHVIKQQVPLRHRLKRWTPTLGGLIFVPIGIIVAHVIADTSSIEVSGASGVTIAFAAVGLLIDILNLTKNHWRGLPAFVEVFSEVIILCYNLKHYFLEFQCAS